MQLDKINNKFLQDYLSFTELTEPPKIMHVWSAISAASASMGRHLWFEFGFKRIYGNMYVLLVGPPATRKGVAMDIADEFVREETGVKYAPEDTGGQRQGLIVAMGGKVKDNKADENPFAMVVDGMMKEFKDLADGSDNPDRHAMYIFADEWGSFIGQNSLDLTRFLIKTYDGRDYTYQLKESTLSIKNSLCGMIGGTTPTEISSLLPPEMIGQGFMSRVVLVYAGRMYKKMKRPIVNVWKKQELDGVMRNIWKEMSGPFKETKEAVEYLDNIYETRDIEITDNRFIYYINRRHSHLIKTSMAMAALRGSQTIEVIDIVDADFILTETEKDMHLALGEYGMSPLAKAKQRMFEFLQQARQPVLPTGLRRIMSRDMRMSDFDQAIGELISSGKVKMIGTEIGDCLIVPKDMSNLENLLVDRSEIDG